jgi:hypothetical protein
MRRRRIICLAAAALVLLTAGAGQAAAPQESRVETATGEAQVGSKPVVHDGGLPFSGLDLALLMAGGGPLLLIGVSLRRRRPEPSVQPSSEETLTLA